MSRQFAAAHGAVPWARSPSSVIEPCSLRRAIARACIGLRSWASSTTTCPKLCSRSSRPAASSSNTRSAALNRAAELDEDELPTRAPRGDGPPLPRAWAEKDPVAARRLTFAREALIALAEEQHLPVENVLTPDYLRRTLWTPPKTRDPEALAAAVAEQLAGYGARPWQVGLAGPVLVDAILTADVEPEVVVPEVETSEDAEPTDS